jgi:predicted PurR-regulated permease PerM
MKLVPFLYLGSVTSIPILANTDILSSDWSKLSTTGLLAVVAGSALWLMYRIAAQNITDGFNRMTNSIDKVSDHLQKLNEKLEHRPCMLKKERYEE